MKKTSYYFVRFSGGRIAEEGGYVDGIRVGPFTIWHVGWNQKKWEATYNWDGKLDGNETSWYGNGQKGSERTYKDGELISKNK